MIKQGISQKASELYEKGYSTRAIANELGNRIREIRNKKKLSVYDVTGEDLSIKSRQHWQKIEAGQLSLTFITLNKIAESLDVSISDLVKNL